MAAVETVDLTKKCLGCRRDVVVSDVPHIPDHLRVQEKEVLVAGM